MQGKQRFPEPRPRRIDHTLPVIVKTQFLGKGCEGLRREAELPEIPAAPDLGLGQFPQRLLAPVLIFCAVYRKDPVQFFRVGIQKDPVFFQDPEQMGAEIEA